MLVTCWSAKGGSGTTVVAAASALTAADPPLVRRTASRTASRGTIGRAPGTPGVLLVDLAGHQPACLGLPEPSGPGIAEWLRADAETPTDALVRMEVPVGPGLDLLPRGEGPLECHRASLLIQVLAASRRTVVVDGGRPDLDELAHRFAVEADRSVAVTRLCLLGLRALNGAPVRPSGVVVLREVGRAIGVGDVVSMIGAPVVADVAVDPSIARAVDAGLLSSRLPRSFAAAVAPVASRSMVTSVD